MFGMGMGELMLILVVALLVVGPDKLPTAAKAIGKGIRDLRRHTLDLQETLEKDENIGEAVRELKSALQGDVRSPPRFPPRPAADAKAAAAVGVPAIVAADSSVAKGEGDSGAGRPAAAPETDAAASDGETAAADGAASDGETAAAKPARDESAHG